jgi:hypothetical protein
MTTRVSGCASDDGLNTQEQHRGVRWVSGNSYNYG